MMASTDLNAVIASLQMAFILMDKLPDVYRIQFRREGKAVVSDLYGLMRCALLVFTDIVSSSIQHSDL